jgi:mRNA interferase MazF
MNSEQPIRKGDIVLVAYPYADEQRRKKRPALALEDANPRGDFAALPITSQAGHQATVALQAADLLGQRLPKASWIRTDQIATLNLNFVHGAYGRLAENKLSEVLALLCPRLGCPGARS